VIRRGALRSIVEPPLFLSPDNTIVAAKHRWSTVLLDQRELFGRGCNAMPWLISRICNSLMVYWFRIPFVTPRSLPAVLTPVAIRRKLSDS